MVALRWNRPAPAWRWPSNFWWPLGTGGGRTPLLGWGTLIAAITVGAVGARHLVFFGALALLCVAIAACQLAYTRPAAALTAALFLLPVSTTKVRERSAMASMRGEVDTQIILELGLYGLIGLVSVAAIASRRFRWRRVRLAELLVAMYVLAAMTSALWSPVPLFTLVKGTQLAVLLLMSCVAARVMGATRALECAASVLAPYVLVCAVLAVLFPWASYHNPPYERVARFSWFYVHPITAATYAGIATLGVYVRARYRFPKRRFSGITWAVVVIVPLLVILVMTRSRGPLIGLVLAVALLIVRSRLPHWFTAVVAAAGVLLAAVYLNSGTSVGEWLRAHSSDTLIQYISRGLDVGNLTDFSGRSQLWDRARAMFVARPVLGYGYGGARSLLLEAMPWAGNAHNGMIQSVLDVGLLGFVPLAAALVRAMAAATFKGSAAGRTSPSRPYAGAAVLVLLTFVLVISFADVGFAEPGHLFALTAGCVLASDEIQSTRATPEVA